MRYLADVGTLARKDLLLELRSRDTVPAMLLFVVSTLVVFHFVLPTGSGDLAANGLLWVAVIFTALLGLSRAFVAEREQHVLDGLVLAPSDRSAIWVGKALSVLAFLALAEVCPAGLRPLLRCGPRRDGRRVRTRGHRPGSRRDAAGRYRSREPGAGASAAAPLLAARDPDCDRRGRRRSGRCAGEIPGVPGPLRRDLRGSRLGIVRICRH